MTTTKTSKPAPTVADLRAAIAAVLPTCEQTAPEAQPYRAAVEAWLQGADLEALPYDDEQRASPAPEILLWRLARERETSDIKAALYSLRDSREQAEASGMTWGRYTWLSERYSLAQRAVEHYRVHGPQSEADAAEAELLECRRQLV